MSMDTRYASTVDNVIIDNGVGHKNDTVFQGVRGANGLPLRYVHMSSKTKYKDIQEIGQREALVRNSNVGAHTIQQAEVAEEFEAGNVSDTQRRALQLCYSCTRYEKAHLASKRNPDMHSLEAIGIFQKVTDKEHK